MPRSPQRIGLMFSDNVRHNASYIRDAVHLALIVRPGVAWSMGYTTTVGITVMALGLSAMEELGYLS